MAVAGPRGSNAGGGHHSAGASLGTAAPRHHYTVHEKGGPGPAHQQFGANYYYYHLNMVPEIGFHPRGDCGLPTCIHAFHAPLPASAPVPPPVEGAGLLTRRVGDGSVEAAEVDEGVGAQEEVGDDGGDCVELRFRDAERRRTVCQAAAPRSRPAPSLAGRGTPDRPLRLGEAQPFRL